VAAGVDLFDCVLPTRHGRHGTVLTDGGRLNLRNARFAADDQPLDPECSCRVCQRWSRAYLRHLLSVREPTGPRLVTVHNVAWTLRFVEAIRDAVRAGRLAAFRQDTTAVWG
jgi:queuine tRNA-ribosyltransferase